MFLKQIQSRTHIASDPLISLADYIAEIGDRIFEDSVRRRSQADHVVRQRSVCP